MAVKLKGFTAFERDMLKVVDRKTIHESIAKHDTDTLVKAIISSARAGIGPGNKAYPDYSDSYKQQLGLIGRGDDFKHYRSVTAIRRARAAGKSNRAARAAGIKAWLIGLGKSKDTTSILNPKKFYIQVRRSGRAF